MGGSPPQLSDYARVLYTARFFAVWCCSKLLLVPLIPLGSNNSVQKAHAARRVGSVTRRYKRASRRAAALARHKMPRMRIQGGWGPKHLGDSGQFRLAKQIAANIEKRPEAIAKAYKWFETAAKLTQAKPPRELPFARLVRDGNNHILTVEALYAATDARVVEKRIWEWKALVVEWESHRRVAAGEVEVLPDTFTAAAEWFGTAKRLTSTDVRTLEHLAAEGNRLIRLVTASRPAWPRGSGETIIMHLLNWRKVVSGWDVDSVEADMRSLTTKHWPFKSRIMSDTRKRLNLTTKKHDELSRKVESWNRKWSEHRAKQIQKRTCSHCGTTAPLSARAFPYCGGCREDPNIPRVDRPRYCSEECQRAHWLAGHMNECPCSG